MEAEKAKQLFWKYYNEYKPELDKSKIIYKKKDMLLNIIIVLLCVVSLYILKNFCSNSDFIFYGGLVIAFFFFILLPLKHWLIKYNLRKNNIKEYRYMLLNTILRKALIEASNFEICLDHLFPKYRINYEDLSNITGSQQFTIICNYKTYTIHNILLDARMFETTDQDETFSTVSTYNVFYSYMELPTIDNNVCANVELSTSIRYILNNNAFFDKEGSFFTSYEMQQIKSVFEETGKRCKLIIKNKKIVVAIFNAGHLLFEEATEDESIDNIYKYWGYTQKVYDIILNKVK